MTSVGLLFVGAVLFLNGAWFLGAISQREVAVFNLFVGALQVVIPTLAIAFGRTDIDTVFNAGGSYLFGFTYLYVGINNLVRNDGRGLGWYSAFVAAMAIVFGVVAIDHDPAFAVIWFVWAAMWTLFFLTLALGVPGLDAFTGWFIFLGGPLTCTVPALLIWRGHWPTSPQAGVWAVVIAATLIAVSAAASRLLPALPVRNPADA